MQQDRKKFKYSPKFILQAKKLFTLFNMNCGEFEDKMSGKCGHTLGSSIRHN